MAESAEVLPQSRRPDGSLRPQVGVPLAPFVSCAHVHPRSTRRNLALHTSKPSLSLLTDSQVRVKKGYVPPEEQQTYDRWKSEKPTGVPGADAVGAPKQPPSKAAAKNAKRKAKNAENGTTPAASASAQSAAAAARPAPAAPAADAVVTGDAAGGAPNELEKKLRALKKKIKAIEELEAKEKAGETLNENQKDKVAAKGEIEAEMARWEGFNDSEELNKEMKKLGKKIRQIEELEARLEGGETLAANQQEKIVAKEKMVDELNKLVQLQASLRL